MATNEPIREHIRFRAGSRRIDGRSDTSMEIWLTDDELITVTTTVLTDISVAATIVLVVLLCIAIAEGTLLTVIALLVATLAAAAISFLAESKPKRDIEALPSSELLSNPSVHGRITWSDVASFEKREFADDEGTTEYVILRAKDGAFFNRTQTTLAIAFELYPGMRDFLEGKLGELSSDSGRTTAVDL